MKTLSVCQPFADLIVSGEKKVENRTWRCAYRGPLLIHSPKTLEYLGCTAKEAKVMYPDMVFGAVVGVAELVGCWNSEFIRGGNLDEQFPWLKDHQHTEGPECWVLLNAVRFPVPVPRKGELNLFDVPDELVQEQLDLIGWKPTKLP